MSAEGQFLVGRVAFDAVRKKDRGVQWVGGLTLGADPIAYAVAHRSWMEGDPIHGFTVRKKPKAYGTGQRIEGGLPEGEPVIVVEDTLTSGTSALEAVDVLEARGSQVLAVLTLVDREAGGTETIQTAGYPLIKLYSASELLEASGQRVPD